MRTTPRRLALALLLSIAPVTLSPVAFAQPAADPTLAAAHARFAEGVAFFDKGEFENARASFLQAYALHKHPAVLINLAQSSLRSGHALDAARDFARYIHDSQSLTAGQRTEAEKGLAEARMKLGRIDVSAAPGTAVTIDGDLAGTDGSTTWDVEPGSHIVKGGSDTTTVNVVAGQTVAVRLGKGFAGAVPVVAPLPSEPVTTPPPAPPADATPTPPPPDASTHHGWRGPESMLPVYLGATVSVAGFATAIVMAVFKGNATTAYNNEVTAISDAAILASPTHSPNAAKGVCTNPTPAFAPGCQALTNDSNAVSTDATVANVGIAVGVIGASFALGWYLLAPRAHDSGTPSTSLRVEPILGHGTQGLTLGGTF